MITWLHIYQGVAAGGLDLSGSETMSLDSQQSHLSESAAGTGCFLSLTMISNHVLSFITMFSLEVAATAVRTAAGDWATTVTTTQVYFEINLRRKVFPADNNIIISSYHYLIIILSSCQASSQTPPFRCPSNSTRLGTNYPRTPSSPGNFCSMFFFSHTYISCDFFSLT